MKCFLATFKQLTTVGWEDGSLSIHIYVSALSKRLVNKTKPKNEAKKKILWFRSQDHLMILIGFPWFYAVCRQFILIWFCWFSHFVVFPFSFSFLSSTFFSCWYIIMELLPLQFNFAVSHYRAVTFMTSRKEFLVTLYFCEMSVFYRNKTFLEMCI